MLGCLPRMLEGKQLSSTVAKIRTNKVYIGNITAQKSIDNILIREHESPTCLSKQETKERIYRHAYCPLNIYVY